MAQNNFTYCCGIAEMGSFFNGLASDRQLIETAVSWAKSHNKGAIIATTIGTQRGAIAALKEAKFEPIQKFRNPNTEGTMITLWFKNLNSSVLEKLGIA